jgi:hypothetical protein
MALRENKVWRLGTLHPGTKIIVDCLNLRFCLIERQKRDVGHGVALVRSGQPPDSLALAAAVAPERVYIPRLPRPMRVEWSGNAAGFGL